MIIILSLLFSLQAHATQVGRFDGTLYYYEGDITVFWQAVTNATHYEVMETWLHPASGAYNIEYDCGTTTATELICKQHRSGFHKYRVRACNSTRCSDWSESIDITKAVCEGTACKWLAYRLLPKPIVIIE